MKKKRVSTRPRFVGFMLCDYRGKKIHFNNFGAENMFGTPSPDKKKLRFVEKILQKPDWVFKSKSFNLLHLLKKINRKDYLLELAGGYEGKKSKWMLRSIKIIKVKKVERNALHYDQPQIWRGIKVIHSTKGIS